MQNKVRWFVFLGGFASFVAGVELWHRHVQNKDSVYQCRILIDKDFSVDDTSPDEGTKIEKISLYVRTKYGVLPRKQSDPLKIFNAYSATVDYVDDFSNDNGSGLGSLDNGNSENDSFSDEKSSKSDASGKDSSEKDRLNEDLAESAYLNGNYLKVAVLVQNATEGSIRNVIARFPDTKISFIIPHYADNLHKIAEIIVSSGNEFFIQLPTQSSIPSDKKETVSPFLANASSNEVRDKLYYLISSAKYAIGIANTSDSLVTKSGRDMEIIARELSQRGMAFLNVEDDSDVMGEITERIKLLSLRAKVFEKSDLSSIQLNKRDSVIVDSRQINDMMKVLPENITLVPISFGEKNASL